MHSIARRHTGFGLVFTLVGMSLGILMASSQNFSQHVTHAHVLLLGTVMSLLYGMVYRLWLPDQPSRLAVAQVWLHQVGTVVIVCGLYALYGGLGPRAAVGQVLGIASLAVITSAALMLLMFLRGGRSRDAVGEGRTAAGPGLAGR